MRGRAGHENKVVELRVISEIPLHLSQKSTSNLTFASLKRTYNNSQKQPCNYLNMFTFEMLLCI